MRVALGDEGIDDGIGRCRARAVAAAIGQLTHASWLTIRASPSSRIEAGVSGAIGLIGVDDELMSYCGMVPLPT
jgi:hypothetical protein